MILRFTPDPAFEWDPDKERINIRKHGIDFEIASRAFRDPDRIERYDVRHSYDEDRYLTIGLAQEANHLFVVIYTMRDSETVRIISARIANRLEEEEYYDRT